MRKIIANWKMNLRLEDALKLAHDYKRVFGDLSDKLEIVVAPSIIHINEIRHVFSGTKIKLAGQNVAGQAKGAYTGEISADMLRDAGCEYSLVWHSERRCLLGEREKFVPDKLTQCYQSGLVPILCVGETISERTAGSTEPVIIKQLQQSLEKVVGLPGNKLLIAYEPVWAIGTKQAAESADLQAVVRIIKRTVANFYSERFFSEKVEILYGGSVAENNVKTFFEVESVNGLLVGLASLDANNLYKIAMAMND